MAQQLTRQQLERLFSSATTLRDYLLVRTQYETGCTISELVQIKHSDIKTSSINVQGRTSAISRELATKLKRFSHTEYVFTSRQSGQMSQKRAEQLIKKQLQNIGVNQTPHILRYTHIVHAAQKGISAQDIQQQTGLGALRVAQISAEHLSTTPKAPPKANNTRDDNLIQLVHQTSASIPDVVTTTIQDLTQTGIRIGAHEYTLSTKLLAALKQEHNYLFASRQQGHITARRAAQILANHLEDKPQTLRYQAILHKREAKSVEQTARDTHKTVARVSQILAEHHKATSSYTGGLL